jgi:hypothetical protein
VSFVDLEFPAVDCCAKIAANSYLKLISYHTFERISWLLESSWLTVNSLMDAGSSSIEPA